MNNIPRCVHTTLVSALGLLIAAGTWGRLTLLTSVTGERVGPMFLSQVGPWALPADVLMQEVSSLQEYAP